MIEMMMRKWRVSENGANGDNDNYCSIFLQSSASSSLRDFGKQIAGSKVPVGQSRLSLEFPVSSPAGNKWSTPDATSVYVSRPRVSRLQIPVSDSRLWVPGSLATPVATPIKTVAAEGVRNVMNPATSPEIQPGAILDY